MPVSFEPKHSCTSRFHNLQQGAKLLQVWDAPLRLPQIECKADVNARAQAGVLLGFLELLRL